MPLRPRFSLAALIATVLLTVIFLVHQSHLREPVDDDASNRLVAAKLADTQSQVVEAPPPVALPSLPPSVAKVSMFWGESNKYYSRAIDTHIRHAKRHGYPVYILERELINGVWNKLAYLLHILVAELDKGTSGARWLMWVDADSVVLNPSLSLDIFLPPADFSHIHVLASKDVNGLNAGMFFMRVDQVCVKLITKALAYPQFDPGYDFKYEEQSALYRTFNDTEYRDHVVYQPRVWWNAYEFHFAYEGLNGDMFAHFAGLGTDRWKSMSEWLDILEDPVEAAKWEMPVAETRYPKVVEQYWATLRLGKNTLDLVHDSIPDLEKSPQNLKAAVDHLRTAMWSESDQVDSVLRAIQGFQTALEIYGKLAESEAAASKPAESAARATSTLPLADLSSTISVAEPAPTMLLAENGTEVKGPLSNPAQLEPEKADLSID